MGVAILSTMSIGCPIHVQQEENRDRGPQNV
jgi:hypothetical protein